MEKENLTNYNQYRLDLEKANMNKDLNPSWDLAYDFKNEYALTDLSKESIYKFVFSDLPNNSQVLQKYISNYWTGSKEKIPKPITKSI